MRVVRDDARGRLPRRRGGRDRREGGAGRRALTRCARACAGRCSPSSLLLTVGVPRALRASATDHAFHDVASFDGGRRARGIDAKTLAGATLQRPRDVRDALPRHGARRLPDARRRARRRRARAAAAARRAAARRGRRSCSRASLGAARVCAAYVVALYAVDRRRHRARPAAGGPTASSTPGVELAAAVVVVVALSLLGSVFLSATANGIAVFMLFGAGLVAGLLGQIGRRARRRDTLDPDRRGSPRTRSRSRRSTRTRSTA